MNKNKSFEYRKVMITLKPEQEAFLDELCTSIRSCGGTSISRTEVIRALVDYLKLLPLNHEDIRDEYDLLERIKSAV